MEVWAGKVVVMVEGSNSYSEGRLVRAWNVRSEGERRNGLVVEG